MKVAYLDSSAVVKLVIPEVESKELLDFVCQLDRAISSELTVIEVGRAASRANGEAGLNRAVEACRRLDLQPIDSHIIDRARRLQPTGLRSLDAVHLASALEPKVAPMLVAYDNRLLEAAQDHSLTVASPGR
ncbi:MAG: type II toxin-antitoxin system VapC family toxin [Candidatus Microthrix sp.]|nr:type II toxin-antitoxin system VapC family toxin [Candidatus Microthrix sp.]